MPRPMAPPFLPVTDAIISTLLPVHAAAVRFAEPTDHVTRQPCSTAIILACSPDGRVSAPVPGSPLSVPALSLRPSLSASAGPSSASPWAASERTSTCFHTARASSDSLSSSSCRLTSVRSSLPSLATASSPVLLTNGATASAVCPLDGGLQDRRPRASPSAWNSIGESNPSGAGNAVRQTWSASPSTRSATSCGIRFPSVASCGSSRRKSRSGRLAATYRRLRNGASLARATSQERSKVRFRDRTATRSRSSAVSSPFAVNRATHTLGWKAPPFGARTGCTLDSSIEYSDRAPRGTAMPFSSTKACTRSPASRIAWCSRSGSASSSSRPPSGCTSTDRGSTSSASRSRV